MNEPEPRPEPPAASLPPTQPSPPLSPPPVAPHRLPRWLHERPQQPAVLVAIAVLALLVLVLLRACGTPPSPPARAHDEIVAAGVLFHTGTPVVLWSDPDGYDAYQTKKHFTVEAEPDGKWRYAAIRGDLDDALRARVTKRGWTLAELQQVVHLFVLHFDVAGSSKRCFRILQDQRILSVHFLLDLDGTIYQTLDLQEHAQHATIANGMSIGIEIAHPGAYPQPRHPELLRWYTQDAQGWRMRFPPEVVDNTVRTPDFIARPDRPEPIRGKIHGATLWQFDFTPQQYAALAHLCAAVHRAFPRIQLDAPRDDAGAVRTNALTPAELRAFDGVVGHWHVQENKQDPGPALQWDRLFADARRLAAAARESAGAK